MLSVINADCRYAECRYAECHYAKCYGAISSARAPYEAFNPRPQI
jgi:hypothetical protein